MRKRTILCALLFGPTLLPFAPLFGCSGSYGAQESPKVGQEATLTQQLKDIDNNPNMPPQAKASAKAAIQQGQNVNLGAGRK